MDKLVLNRLDGFRDVGVLVMRVGLGLMFVGHGWGKLVGGPEKWEKIGGAMSTFGIDFAPVFWGFMAAFAEVFGGLALAAGLAMRPVLLGLLIPTMIVAAAKHMAAGDGFKGYSHAVEVGIAFVGLALIGPGRFSLDAKLFGARSIQEERADS
jgi:putative oxidoreductase